VNGGAAVWTMDTLMPQATKLITTPRNLGWLGATKNFTTQLREFMEPWRIGMPIVACEWPKLFESEAGQAAARRGDLVKLAFVVGRIAELTAQMGFMFTIIPVNNWKGTMDKGQVERRIARIVGPESTTFKSHVWDAVGIGLYYRGLFK
jgi:hypothetical protein